MSISPRRVLFPVFVELCFDGRLDFFVERPIILQRFLGRIAALRSWVPL